MSWTQHTMEVYQKEKKENEEKRKTAMPELTDQQITEEIMERNNAFANTTTCPLKNGMLCQTDCVSFGSAYYYKSNNTYSMPYCSNLVCNPENSLSAINELLSIIARNQ